MDSMTQSVDKQGELVAAIAAATGEIGAVAKTGRNMHDRYTYSSDEDFARAVQPVLARYGLALVPIEMAAEWYDTETGKGRTMRGCVLTVRWLLMHSAGGSQEMVTIGEGIDRSDKAAYKAQTGARKYALRLAFQIPTSDDAEVDTPTPSAPSKPSEPKRKPRAVLIDAAKEAAGDDARKFTRWVAAINAQPDRLLPTLAQRIGKVDDVGAALDKLKVKK